MNEHPSDPVTLDDLKRAIDSFQTELNHPRGDEGHDLQLSRAKAWRAAFKWHVCLIKRHADLSEAIDTHLTDWIAIDREEEEGMALIREKLL